MDQLEEQQNRRIMGGKTRYSRDTWTKSQLRDNISNAPKYGNKACNLCEHARIPDDLFFKVSKYKTCGDVHLELSLINPDQATCQAGQDAYRDMCCPRSFLGNLVKPKPALSVAVGLILFWFFAKKARRVSCAPLRRDDDDDEDNDIKGDGNDDVEGRGRTSYQRMTESESTGKKRTRSRSKSKDRAHARSRSKSRDRNGTLGSRSRDASKAAKNSRNNNVVQTFKSNKSQGKNQNAVETRIQPTYHLHEEARWQENGFIDEASANAYYNLDEDPSFNDNSTMAGNTMAGETIDAVVTQVV
jgi:hypothetical protein